MIRFKAAPVCIHRSLREALRGEHRHPEKDHQEEDQSVPPRPRAIFQRNVPLLHEPDRTLATGNNHQGYSNLRKKL